MPVMVMRHRRRLGGPVTTGEGHKKCVSTAAHKCLQVTVRGTVTSCGGHKECVLRTAHKLAAKQLWSLRNIINSEKRRQRAERLYGKISQEKHNSFFSYANSTKTEKPRRNEQNSINPGYLARSCLRLQQKKKHQCRQSKTNQNIISSITWNFVTRISILRSE